MSVWHDTASTMPAPIHEKLPRFVPVRDVGTFKWLTKPTASCPCKSHGDVSEDDVRSRMTMSWTNGEEASDSVDALEEQLSGLGVDSARSGVAVQAPRLALSRVHCPVSLLDVPPCEYISRFPYDQGAIASVVAAKQAGVDLSTIDFVMGGSTLHVLSQRSVANANGHRWFAQRIGDMIVVVKFAEYTVNSMAFGYQFERLVTGQAMDNGDTSFSYQHLRVMKIGDFNVLLCAEVDASDDSGVPVEIKSGNPKYFGTKLLMQMISSGSKTLVRADRPSTKVNRVIIKSFDELMADHSTATMKTLHDNVIKSLSELLCASEIIDSVPVNVSFSSNQYKLALERLTEEPVPTILPSTAVVRRLLAGEND